MIGQDWTPGRLLATSGSYWEGCTLHAGVKLGIFTILDEKPLDTEAVSGRIGASLRGTAMLLNALTAMGLLTRADGEYANTEFSHKVLARGSAGYLGHMIGHHHNLVPFWAKLDRAVLSGTPERGRDYLDDEQALENFLMGMFNVAMATAPAMAEEVDLSGRSHLLDLGGGPGTHAVHFCMKNPGLRATIMDLPFSRTFAEQTVARFGLSERVGFVDGDYLRDSLPVPFDVVLMSQILHQQSPEECRQIISRAARAVEPGGLVLVHEFLLDDTLDGPLFPALFSLNMLLNTSSGQAYSEGQIQEMFEEAGLRDIKRLPFRGPTDSGIIAGVR